LRRGDSNDAGESGELRLGIAADGSAGGANGRRNKAAIKRWPFLWRRTGVNVIQAGTGAIAALAAFGIVLRPRGLPEAIWAVAGAALLIGFGFLPVSGAWHGVLAGLDVYLFLVGMMLLSEVARESGLFDWLAALATRLAKGSPGRLFALVYGVGIVVTVFLSNDATAVVLTPAVAAAMRTAAVSEPLPYLLVCAFIANAASFVLPISNPANLVVYGSHMPPLFEWLPLFALPSLVSIAATYGMLRWSQRRWLSHEIVHRVATPLLSFGGRVAGTGIVATAFLLMAASSYGCQLGPPTAVAGLATAAATLLAERTSPLKVVRGVSWGVLPLVAGLFVLVEGLQQTGTIPALGTLLLSAAEDSAAGAAWAFAGATALAANLVNNLPAGLVAATVFRSAEFPEMLRRFVLIAVDLGPNLSVTGSLATILWLSALRREGISVGGWAFLKIGVVVMPPALVLSLLAAWISGPSAL
jgi:arsenical pump membrane protein